MARPGAPIINEPKVSRAIRLDKPVDDDLIVVCRLLGVNPNAYLRQVVGEAIHKHMAHTRAEEAAKRVMAEKMDLILSEIAAQGGPNNGNSD